MQSRLSVLLLVFTLFLVYWQWFLLGPKVASDFSFIYDDLFKSLIDVPRTWSEKGAEGLGEYTTFFLWSWPLSFISGLISYIGLSFSILERVLIILFMLIGSLGIWKICENINISNSAKFIVCLFYLINTYILLIIDGGQLSIALAYGWFPLSFLAIEKSISSRLHKKVVAGLTTAVLGFFDFRFIYILFLLSLIRFLYQFLFIDRKKWWSWILDWATLGMINGLIVIGLNFYWLFPLTQAPIQQGTYTFFTQVSFPSFGNLGHSILMLAPHWYKNIFGNITPLRFEFILIPILVFLAPFLKPKDKQVGFWVLIALISIFLTKGTSEPFSRVYPWLFSNLPGFSLFRDSTKFFFLTALSYSILLGITTNELMKGFQKLLRFKIILLVISTGYLLFLIRPVFLSEMTGTFSKPPLQKEYLKLANFLDNDQTFSRVFWIPNLAPLGYSSPDHPRVEALRFVQKRPFAIGTQGTYEIFNFLREAPYMGEIFDVSGIGYVVYPPLDKRREDSHPDKFKYYDTFSNQLTNLPWLSRIWESPVPLWRVKNYQDRFFITDNIWLTLGSDRIYNESTKSAKLKLSDNALIFVEEHPGLGNIIDKLPEAKIVLGNKIITDLAASFIDSQGLIFPAKNLKNDPDQSGWWKREAKDLINWRDFLKTKYGLDNLDFDLGGGWAVGEGSKKFQMVFQTAFGRTNIKFQMGNTLLARVLESTRSGQLKFYQGGNLIGEINTRNEGNNVRWFEVGQLPNDARGLEIRSTGDVNVVNALAILEKEEWLKLQNKARSLGGRIVNFIEENTKQKDTIVTYQQINPTRYKVSIKNLTDPGFVVFSQSYDGFWKMNGQRSLPVYSLLNGFRVEKDGEYFVEFEVQKYVYPGFVVSLVTLALVFYLLLFHKQKQSSI